MQHIHLQDNEVTRILLHIMTHLNPQVFLL